MPTNETAANETGTARPPTVAAGRRAGAAPASGTSVSLRDLTRAFGAARALDEMSLDIAPGRAGRAARPVRLRQDDRAADRGRVRVSPTPARC